MARRKTSDNEERRTAFIGANVTVSERLEAERRATLAGRQLSEFIRYSVLTKRTGPTPQPKISNDVGRKLAVQLAKIGTNLNQLSHHANATNSMPERDALNATLDEIVKATEALTRL